VILLVAAIAQARTQWRLFKGFVSFNCSQ